MKKYIFLLLVMFFSICSSAQTEHLKFMGIELNGTITAFQTKLQTKGVKISPSTSKMPNGMRLFNGIFSGEEAEIAVWYNPRSKDVYRAKAMIERYGKDLIEQLFNKMEAKLDLKYGTDCKTSKIVKDDYLQEFKQVSYDVGNGTIGLFVVSTSYTSQSRFYLHVDYYDAENQVANIMDEMDDL